MRITPTALKGRAPIYPLNIERALRKEFSDRPGVARLQRVALAHIEAERELEDRMTAGESAMSPRVLIATHHALYSRLSEEDRTTKDGRVVVPGEVRKENVEVGLHIPPTAASLPHFLARMDHVYDRPLGWDSQLIAVACAHYRAAWVHPFLDSNGRAVRLRSYGVLWPLSDGLWSPSRGLTGGIKDYYTLLHNADRDGHGNPTTAGPVARSEFAQMTGLEERTARTLMSRLLHTGLLASDSAADPVRFGLPLDALQFLFPELYPKAATKPY